MLDDFDVSVGEGVMSLHIVSSGLHDQRYQVHRTLSLGVFSTLCSN